MHSESHAVERPMDVETKMKVSSIIKERNSNCIKLIFKHFFAHAHALDRQPDGRTTWQRAMKSRSLNSKARLKIEFCGVKPSFSGSTPKICLYKRQNDPKARQESAEDKKKVRGGMSTPGVYSVYVYTPNRARGLCSPCRPCRTPPPVSTAPLTCYMCQH